MTEARQAQDHNKADMLEKAGTIFKKVTSQLYIAAQAAQDGDNENADKHLNLAMHYQDEAQKLLDQL